MFIVSFAYTCIFPGYAKIMLGMILYTMLHTMRHDLQHHSRTALNCRFCEYTCIIYSNTVLSKVNPFCFTAATMGPFLMLLLVCWSGHHVDGQEG